MELDLALLADAAAVDSSGKLSVLGIFDRISAPQFPARHARIALVLRFSASSGDSGEHTVQIRLSGPDDVEVVRIEGKMGVPAGAPAPAPGFRNAQVLNLDGLVFPKPGAYAFDVSLDGEHRLSVPLSVVKVAGPKGGGDTESPAIIFTPGARGIPEA